MLQQVDLETLQFILSQFSEDISDDCSKIIAKLLKSLSVSMLDESKICNEKVFASVKILLKLYECLNPNSSSAKTVLPINIIIESVKLFFQCDGDCCRLPKNDIQLNILSIISSVLKNGLLRKSLKELKELAEFYEYNVISISSIKNKKECKSDCLIFKLKILTLMYQVLADVGLESLNTEFCKTVKSFTASEECELLADMTLHEDDRVAFQALFHLIPAQIKCYKSSQVLEVIWKRISGSMCSEISHYRVLTILCQVFDLNFEKSVLLYKVDLITLLLKDEYYWKLILFTLKDKDAMKRKQGLYLFKSAFDMLNSGNINLICGNTKYFFYWHLNCKDELYKIYSEIIVVLEFLEEQQIHIIKPIFKLIDTVTESILNSNKVNFLWILVIFEKAMSHESLQVVKWGLSNLLKLQDDFFLNEYIARETAELLAGSLNNLSLYFNNGLDISTELKAFFDKVAHMRTCKIFFSAFIKKLCSQVWSPEALFFVIHSLSNKDSDSLKCTFWGKEEFSEIITFVSKAFKTYNKIIRIGVQTELLNACLALTDKKDVTLENIIFLIYIFFEREVVKVGSKSWANLLYWLKDSYPKEDAKHILEKYLLEKSKNKPKYVSLMFILFYYTYDSESSESGSFDRFESLESHDKNIFALNYFQNLLLSFKEIHKRPYCNKLLHDDNLSIISYVYEANLKNCMPDFIRPTLPFLKDVILYIQTQLKQISGLEDYNELELYLSTFEYITKTLILFKFDVKYANHLYIEILKELESCIQMGSNICSVGMFWRIKILYILMELNFFEPKPTFLDNYLINKVNETLTKDNNYSDKTRDLLTLWGKLNSEFLEKKWKILKYLINNNLVFRGRMRTKNKCWISNDDLTGLCVEALNTGGYRVLCPVMSILKNLLPEKENDFELKKIIDSVWNLIIERKKTEEFKVFVRMFIEMVFQQALIDKAEETIIKILLEYMDLIFSNSSLAVVNIFMKHIQRTDITKSIALYCLIIGKGLIFGSVEKRDERLTKAVCSYIEFFEICNIEEMSDYQTSNEIRARAVQKILQLDKKSPVHQAIAKQLIDTLLKMENDLNKNRVRYFGNSHAHRVKHRLMQALLLLEPMLDENEDQAIKLSEWIIRSLVCENSQPSVRFMQEWLLIRMLIRHSKVYNFFGIFNYYNESEENKKKGACSLIAVTYHLYRLTHSDLIGTKAASVFCSILYFCFHRHFELRLYAQVAFLNFYEYFAKLEGWDTIIQPYECLYETLKEYIDVECKRNKNLSKLMNNFYFQDFHPLNNFSLEMIYKSLPGLTDVSSDEWISPEMFQYCGVKSSEVDIPLKDSNFSLKSAMENIWLWKTFELPSPTEFDDRKTENFLDNYQKKIIPIKPLIPGWTESNASQNTLEKDGLIVVASLIDRLPNLGGLARTCEVFGVSEYIINSLKHIEDKQFTSLSVTAEKWIALKEVKIHYLLEYISEMKQKGYTIVGAEQALHSQPLNAVKFPKKSLLLLGNEKEGIPPNLLPFLDVCVEIPQLGFIRSLNVHVTGALFIWEYAKQHHFS